ncbi:MAG: D-tyrosyl-tRNA(Tyr) deacylase [Deltaproteobacteria bacterium]|nr:D-tyrosyl-tRNA(Tyr) deacylase [Deltaproteobacteria bacterium]
MKAVVQRVAGARVEVAGEVVGAIDRGLLVYLGVAIGDELRDVEWLAEKVRGLRIFEDEQGKMNRDVADVGGGVLVISQFTLLGDCRRGRRPSFSGAMPPETAERLYESFVAAVRAKGVPVETGRFRAEMKVHSLNDGPVTMLIDSREGEARSPGAPSPLPTAG